MKCACGQPLHYIDPASEEVVQKLVDKLGEFVDVGAGGKIYKIPRHGRDSSDRPRDL